MTEQATTATVLGAFLAELNAKGFDYPEAIQLVHVFAREIAGREKLTVDLSSVVTA